MKAHSIKRNKTKNSVTQTCTPVHSDTDSIPSRFNSS